MKRTHRLRKKLLKKRFPFSDEWKPRRTGYRERLHSCPVCGKSRRAGYYECCASCFWVFEWQDKVRGLIAQASDMMKPRGASLGVAFYTPEVATIGLTIRAFCDPEDSARYQREGDRTTAQFEVNLRAREFRASTRISLLDLRNAREPKKIMLDEILELFEKSQKEMHNYIDRNGVMKTLGGCPVPVAGGCWGDPRFRGVIKMQKRYFIGPQIVDKETFYQRASTAGLFPKFSTAKYIYRRVWEFGITPDGVHFQRAFMDGVDHPGELFMAVRIK